jgi:hypothetical protein
MAGKRLDMRRRAMIGSDSCAPDLKLSLFIFWPED